MDDESLTTALYVENSLPWWWQLSQLFAKNASAKLLQVSVVQAAVVELLPPELLPPELEDELEEELLLVPEPLHGNPVQLEVPLLELLLLELLLLPELLLPLEVAAEQLPEIGMQLLPTGLLFWLRICSQVALLGQLWPLLQSTPQ